MQLELTSQEKVLFNAHKKFHMEHGESEAEAIEAANKKILSVRALSKKVKFRH
jgi:hypothetical protein